MAAFTIIDGDGMSADDAAWASIAGAVEAALSLPGLSADGSARLERLQASCLRAAGLPPRPTARQHDVST